jgi:hypothetical protein
MMKHFIHLFLSRHLRVGVYMLPPAAAHRHGHALATAPERGRTTLEQALRAAGLRVAADEPSRRDDKHAELPIRAMTPMMHIATLIPECTPLGCTHRVPYAMTPCILSL